MARDLEKYERDYLQASNFENHQVQFRRKLVLERLNLYPHQSILEIGCGVEPLFTHIHSFQNYTVVEPVSKFVQIAKQKSQGDQRIQIIHGELEAKVPELSQKSYDLIILSSLVHEVENPKKLIASLKQLMSSQTIVHVNCPNALSFHRLLGLKMGLLQNPMQASELAKKYQRHSEFTLETLRHLLTQENLAIVAQGSYFIKPFSHAQMQKMVEAQIIDEHTLNGLYLLSEMLPEYGSEIYIEAKKR